LRENNGLRKEVVRLTQALDNATILHMDDYDSCDLDCCASEAVIQLQVDAEVDSWFKEHQSTLAALI
jgi:hypothetical protein